MKFRKKPVVIEAIQFTGSTTNYQDIEDWSKGAVYIRGIKLPDADREMEINTLEGTMRAIVGDWIIKGIKGEFYPCKHDIFEATYEAVDEAEERR